jgi:hypothetical protein
MSLEALVLCESLEKCSELAAAINRAARRVLTELVPSPLATRELDVTVANHEARLRFPLGTRQFAALLAALAQRM